MSTVTELVETIGQLLTQVDADLGAAEAKNVECQKQIVALQARIAELEAQVPPDEVEEPPPPPPEPPPPDTGTINVRNASELWAAREAGTTDIVLASGNYGALSLSHNFTNPVRIRSATAHGAVFDSVSGGGSGFTLENVAVRMETRFDGAHHYTVKDCKLGTALQREDMTGLYNTKVKFAKVIGCDIKGAKYALIFNYSSDIEVISNKVWGSRIDLMRFGYSHRGKVWNNFLVDTLPIERDHPDAMQFFANNDPSGITNWHVRGNYLWDDKRTGPTFMQGIFIKDANFYENFLVEENLLGIASPNTIYFNGHTAGGKNIVIRNNTLRGWTNPGNLESNPGGGVLNFTGNCNGVIAENNVCQKIYKPNATNLIERNNFVAPVADWAKFFKGDPSTWQGFIPVPGSPIDFGTPYGAQARLKELMAG